MAKSVRYIAVNNFFAIEEYMQGSKVKLIPVYCDPKTLPERPEDTWEDELVQNFPHIKVSK